MIALGNGVATFGGGTGPDGRLARRGPNDPTGLKFDAPLGLYIAAHVGPDGVPNESGWAYWAGTSFATPIISGLAARLWQRDPGRSARQVMGQVRDLALPLAGADELDVPVVRVRQNG
jgi:subtilisin family serine protease